MERIMNKEEFLKNREERMKLEKENEENEENIRAEKTRKRILKIQKLEGPGCSHGTKLIYKGTR